MAAWLHGWACMNNGLCDWLQYIGLAAMNILKRVARMIGMLLCVCSVTVHTDRVQPGRLRQHPATLAATVDLRTSPLVYSRATTTSVYIYAAHL